MATLKNQKQMELIYSDLVESMINHNVVKVTSMLTDLSMHDLVFLHAALDNIQNILGIVMRLMPEEDK